MMKKRNLYLLIMQLVTFGALFIPCDFVEHGWFANHTEIYEQTNFFRGGTEIPCILGIIYAVVLAVDIGFLADNVLLKNYRKNAEKLIKIGTRVTGIVFAVVSATNVIFDTLSTTYDPKDMHDSGIEILFGWLWYLLAILQILAIIFTFIKTKKDVQNPSM